MIASETLHVPVPAPGHGESYPWGRSSPAPSALISEFAAHVCQTYGPHRTYLTADSRYAVAAPQGYVSGPKLCSWAGVLSRTVDVVISPCDIAAPVRRAQVGQLVPSAARRGHDVAGRVGAGPTTQPAHPAVALEHLSDEPTPPTRPPALGVVQAPGSRPEGAAHRAR